MTRGDRDALARLARQRGKQAKAEAEQREKVLLAEVEDLMAAEFSARDKLWAEAVAIAEEAARKANDVIQARCVDLGIPARHAPSVSIGWEARSRSFGSSKRRTELRKLAQSRLAALTATAKLEIDRQTLETETLLLAGGLQSGEAQAFLAAMPTVDRLMPSLSLDDLGVRHWQPPTGAAGALLTPSTPADRRRKLVLRAIEAHPGASDREIARVAGCDHKTVAAYRRAAEELPAPAGELPNETGELPSDDEGDGWDDDEDGTA